MKRWMWIVVVAVALFFGGISFVVYVASGGLETTLEFKVVDSVSEGWVWDAAIRLQDRSLRTYYQSDQGSTDLKFTRLKPGKWDLVVNAPHYVEQSVQVRLHRGRNVLEQPVRLVGREIPNLSHFIIIDTVEGRQVSFEIRPVSTAGPAVTNHPALDIWLGCLISEQTKNGAYVQKPEDSGSDRGEMVYAHRLEVVWDPAPETNFRYSATLPLQSVSSAAPFWVIDYLVVVPDPTKTDKAELEEIMGKVLEIGDSEKVATYLDQYKDRLSYYFPPPSWNVKGGA